MSSAISGKLAIVKVGANRVAEIKGWSLNCGVGEIDVTTLDSSGWKELLMGIKEWSASTPEGPFIPSDTNGQKALMDAYFAGTTVAIGFWVNGTINFSGSAFVKPALSSEVGGVAQAGFEFSGTGALTPTYT
jgi:predicted secreted protein